MHTEQTKIKMSEKRKSYLETLTHEEISKSTEIGRAKSIEARVKTFYLRDPKNQEYIVTNLKPWCREHPEYALDSSTLIKVAKGLISNSKGWICRYYENEKIVEPEVSVKPRTKNKSWKVISPTGQIFDVVNLKQFCLENNLSYGAMKEIGEGKRQSLHKGWTLETQTPDFSGVKTAFLEEQEDKIKHKKIKLEEKRLASLITTSSGEIRKCIEFPEFEIGDNICYLYLLTNILDGKKYVGVSDDPKRRLAEHCRYKKTNVIITNALKKYGVHCFDKEIIYKGTVQECFEKEDEFILLHNSNEKLGGHGYNQKEGGKGNRQGCSFGPEFAAKISASMTGKQKRPWTAEERLQRSLAQKGRQKGPMSEEEKLKRSITQKGRPLSEAHKNNIKSGVNNQHYVSIDVKKKSITETK